MSVFLKRKAFEVLLVAFVSFLYFSLNSERPELFKTWITLGTLLIVAAWFAGFRLTRRLWISPFFFGAGFLAFQCVKALAGINEPPVIMQAGIKGAFFWLFQGALFLSVYGFSSRKTAVEKMLKTFIFLSFFLSLNQLIPLIENSYGYDWKDKTQLFFHPLIYQFVPFSDYFFGYWCSMNWAGGFIAFGIFSGLGFIFYDLYRALEKKERVHWGMTGAFFCITAINAAVLILLQSRGSLVAFTAALVFYLVLLAFKWKCRFKPFFIGVLITALLGAAAWVGNVSGALKEIRTLSEEIKPETQRSWAVNQEGQKRALRMFQARPVFGVGYGNYAKVSEEFADLGEDTLRLDIAKLTCMSHYFLMMAEEGSGSFVYFLFLGSFILWVLWKIFMANSQFKVLAGISLLTIVLMVLGHAAINDLMGRFGLLTLVMTALAVMAGLFRGDFDHES